LRLSSQAIKLSNTVSPRLKLKRLLHHTSWAHQLRVINFDPALPACSLTCLKECTLRAGTRVILCPGRWQATSVVSCTESDPHVCQRSQKCLCQGKHQFPTLSEITCYGIIFSTKQIDNAHLPHMG